MPDKENKFPFFKRVIQTPSIEFLIDMVSVAEQEIIIVSPWIKKSVLQKIINATQGNKNIKWIVLSRGNSKDFLEGFSDIEAFKLMIENPLFELHAIKNIHAKVYIVDGKISLVTSANLTVGGMEISPEMGLATIEKDEIEELKNEIMEWFTRGKLLDNEWLKNEHQKIIDFQNKKQNTPFETEDVDKKSKLGNYRELSLPEGWKPLLNVLRETKAFQNKNLFSLDDLVIVFLSFFDYIKDVQGDDDLQDFLLDWLVNGKTLEDIGNRENIEVSRQRISQRIGKPGEYTGEIWRSENGIYFMKQIALFVHNLMDGKEIIVSSKLEKNIIERLGLSPLDLGKFIINMIRHKILNVPYEVQLTSTNRLSVSDKEIYTILKELERIYCTDYSEFMDLESFCKLGELKKIDVFWLSPETGVFENIYITESGKIGCKNWGVAKAAEAIAIELAIQLECYYWHYSEMRNALQYLFPKNFETSTIQYVRNQLSDAPNGKFQRAGCRGIWQLSHYGDGHSENKDSLISIFKETGRPLTYEEIYRELRARKRCVNEKSIESLLHQKKDVFDNLKRGTFFLKSKRN